MWTPSAPITSMCSLISLIALPSVKGNNALDGKTFSAGESSSRQRRIGREEPCLPLPADISPPVDG
jgi:hypothetical protein